MENKTVLNVDNIVMQFGGLRAIDGVSFSINEAEIFGLIGPNGAGKTTMFNVITSNYKPTSGCVSLGDTTITGLKPNVVVNKGIARTFQNIRLFGSMTVLENVLIGFDRAIDYSFIEAALHMGRFFSAERKAKEEAMKILEYIGIAQHANALATNLSYGNQRKVEIARALAQLIFKMRDDFKLTVLLIEHDMSFVNTLCERVMVLDYGKPLFSGKTQEAINNKEVIAAYLGDIDYA